MRYLYAINSSSFYFVKHLTLFCLLLVAANAIAQKKNERYRLNISKTHLPVKIDGDLSDSLWQKTEVATDFYMVLPMDTSFARLRTEVRMAYDKKFLYVSAVNFQSHRIMVESLRRDWNFGKNDNFIFFMDPFDDQTNGFTFGANAFGAEWDGQQFDGGSANLNWDNRWFSAVKRTPDRWVFEAAIPFKTLRYKKGITRWGINFSRNDLTTTEKSSWAPVPRQMPTASLAYTGVLQWDAPPPKAGMNISLIPYLLGGVNRNVATDESDAYADAGIDAKIAVSSAMNLDLTVNPDFSQVEVDRQVTNLDRFELFFPERRQFFLENSDLFNNLGNSTLRPFFSRRIGLNVPIRAGARLSGRIDKNWRVGVMDMQTGPSDDGLTPAENFGVMTFQRRVQSRSNITGFLINKESFKEGSRAASYNRNAGLEYNLASKNDVWRGKFLYFKSFDQGVRDSAFATSAQIRYNNRKLVWEFQQEYVGHKYNPEVGYLPRPGGYHKSVYNARYYFFPKNNRILTHSPAIMGFTVMNEFGNSVENETALLYDFTFRDRTLFTVWAGNNYIKLLQGFDPTNKNKITLPANTHHIWNSWGTHFESKPQSLFTYGFDTRYGGYYANGTRLRVAGNVAYRVQPYGIFAVSAEYNDIKFPQSNPYGLKNAYFWLISPRIDLTFSKKLYFTTFVQYNEQINNVNLNTRIQWRYAPASDLYFVYTDNYLPEVFSAKSRAFVLKLTYWWNV